MKPRLRTIRVNGELLPDGINARMKRVVKPELYEYRWNRMGRKGQLCWVRVRGKLNSCLVEFLDGFKAVTSRNAIRKIKGGNVP